jgi:hypothetical protein
MFPPCLVLKKELIDTLLPLTNQMTASIFFIEWRGVNVDRRESTVGDGLENVEIYRARSILLRDSGSGCVEQARTAASAVDDGGTQRHARRPRWNHRRKGSALARSSTLTARTAAKMFRQRIGGRREARASIVHEAADF